MFQLHEEQDYVRFWADKLRINFKIVEHPVATNTCREKADLLSRTFGAWPEERVVKANYYFNQGRYVGVVLPGPVKFSTGKNLPELLGVSRTFAEGFVFNGLPKGMDYGTATPLALRSSVLSGEIEKLLLFEEGDKLVDISLGGFGDEAHKISMHIMFYGIRDISLKEFGGERIKIFNKIR